MLVTLFFISFTLYIILIVSLSLYLLFKNDIPIKKPITIDGISVIVAFKNEQFNLAGLISSINKLIDPNCLYEIILVNDRSTDQSIAFLNEAQLTNKSIRIIDAKEVLLNQAGKKNALQHGINAANFSILAFTDADCHLPNNWLKEIESRFSEGCDVLIGKAPLFSKNSSFLTDWQETETFFSHLIAYISYKLNHSLLAFGRNFAYTKSIFDQVGGFSSIKNSQSGDDDLLLNLFRKAKAKVVFTNNHPVKSLSETIFKRWHSQKIRHYSVINFLKKSEQFVSFSLHTWHVLIYLGILMMGAWHLLIIKVMADYLLFFISNKQLKFLNIFKIFFLWECFYALLNLYFIISVKFVSKQSTRWK
jgi:biofilm PGA synthesis N-glycosyltransferase PgaC